MDTVSVMQPDTTGYLDSPLDLLRDCRSGDPARRPACIIASVLGALGAFFVPTFAIVGIIGNALTTYLMLSEPRLKCRQNLYLAFIAVSNSGNLIFWGLGWQMVAKGLPWISDGTVGFFIVNVSDSACRAFCFVHNFFPMLSANWFLLMTLDRVLSLHCPFRFMPLTTRSACKALLAVLVVTAVLAAPIPILEGWTELQNLTSCLPVPDYGSAVRMGTVVYQSLFMRQPLVQLLVISLANLFLLRRVVRILRNRRTLASTAATAADTGSGTVAASVVVLLLSLFYLLSSLPDNSTQLIALYHIASSSKTDMDWLRTVFNFGDIGQILLLFSQAMQWVVLVWKNRTFRDRFVRALTCRLRRTADSAQSTDSVARSSSSRVVAAEDFVS